MSRVPPNSDGRRRRRLLPSPAEAKLRVFGKNLPPMAAADPRPDWQQAEPAWIRRALARSQALPGGGWYVLDASRSFGARPRRLWLRGRPLVVWRGGTGSQLMAAADICPHLGAALSEGRVCAGRLVCPWHGLHLGPEPQRGFRPLFSHDDGYLFWVRLGGADHVPAPALRGGADHVPAPALRGGADHVPAAALRGGADHVPAPALRGGADHVPAAALRGGGGGGGEHEPLSERPFLPPRPDPASSLDAVIRLEAECEPEDILANRLDPWHGAHYHPHSFGRLRVVEQTEEAITVRVAFKVLGPFAVEVDARFHCPDPRSIVMTIVGGEGEGSVVETHATPLGPGRSAIVELSLASSERLGFAIARRARGLLRPVVQWAALRLWREDARYAERLHWLRRSPRARTTTETTDEANAE